MDVRGYCNILQVTTGVVICKEVIRLSEEYMKDNILGMSIRDVVEAYRIMQPTPLCIMISDYLIKISDTVYMLPNNSNIVAEYKNKCKDLVKLRTRLIDHSTEWFTTGMIPEYAQNDVVELYWNNRDVAKLLLKDIGKYNDEDKTFSIAGSIFENVREDSIGFMHEYEGLTFEGDTYSVDLTLDTDYGEWGTVVTRGYL